MNRRMDRTRLNIGTYHLKEYARTEEHVKDLSGCGIDFVIGAVDRKTLDLFAKYGVGSVMPGVVPGWWGGDGDNAGTFEATHPFEKYIEGASKFEDHPAIWGIDIGDEPSAVDFPHYGKVFSLTDSLFPSQFPYLNLYPNYASVSKNTADETVNQLGTPTYDEHIQKYCENVPSDYICYDFYVYCTTVRKAYENLITVANACRRTGRDMWIVLQVNSHVPEKCMSENMLRFQAFSAMAFGVNVITWACYTAGWWYNQVLDEQGEKTPQYEKLRKVNGEIKALAPVYMQYRVTGTHFIGDANDPDISGSASIKPVPSLSNGFVRDLKAEDGLNLLAGEMCPVAANANGIPKRALFLCAADEYKDEHHRTRTVTFETTAKDANVTCTGPKGKKAVIKDGNLFRIELESCEGCMVEIN